MTPHYLDELVVAGDRDRLCRALAPLDETQRKALAESTITLYSRINDLWGPGGREETGKEPLDAGAEALVQALSKQNYVDWRVPRWCAGLAVTAVCDQKSIFGYHGSWFHSDYADMPHRALQVLNDRRPPWLEAFIRKAVKQREFPFIGWSVERGLIRSGAIAASDDDGYVERFAMGVARIVGQQSDDAVRTDTLKDLPQSMTVILLADPDLLKHDVWRLFEVQNSGLERDYFGWSETLKELAEQGHLDRQRLLSASASALMLSVRPASLAGYAKFHEFLDPTLDERASLLSEYLKLLASGSAGAGVAVGAFEELAKAKRLDAGSFLEACPQVFHLDKKGVPSKALKIIKRLLKEQPACRSASVPPLIAGLGNVSPDVQEEALGLLETVADQLTAATRSELLAAAEQVAASLRSRVEALAKRDIATTASSGQPGASTKKGKTAGKKSGSSLGKDAIEGAVVGGALLPVEAFGSSVPHTPKPDGQECPSYKLRIEAVPASLRAVAGVDAALEAINGGLDPVPPVIDSRFAPRRDPSQAVVPIGSLDELIDAVSTFVEGCDSAMEVERILDGISRFHHEKPEGFEKRVAPLRKRIEATSERVWTTLPSLLVVAADTGVPQLIRQWLGMPEIFKEWGNWYDMPLRFFRGRVREISYRLDPQTRESSGLPLLSLPTHRDGWLDPVVLVERIEAYVRAEAIVSNNLDIAQALLRLTPDGCDEAQRAIVELRAGPMKEEWNADWYAKSELNALQFALGEPLELNWRTGGLGFEERCLAAAHARATRGHPFDPPLPFTIPSATLREDGSIQFCGPITNDMAYPGALMLQAHSWGAVMSDREAWGGNPGATWHWLTDWQNMVWPNNRAAACLHAIQFGNAPHSLNNLLDSDWTWTDEACRLAAWALGTENADCKLRATDALVQGVVNRTFVPAQLGCHVAAIVEKLKLNRVAAVLAETARISPLHQWSVFATIDAMLDRLTEPIRDLHHLLTVLLETATLIGRSVGERSRTFLASITGSSKSAKLAQQILAVKHDPQRMATVRESALAASLDRAERWLVLQQRDRKTN